MARISQYIVGVTDLLEAEGRSFREVARAEGRDLKQATTKVLLGFAVLLAAAPLAVVGLGLLLAALFWALREPLGQPAAAAITGVVTLCLCGGLLWLYKKLTTN
ncbi:MAG TPA: phage holin family protein [Phycisphaerales bacterium]|nr:phage holin family protein [Phycisphaerales bacterium]